eukprot:21381-Eustigmatos_ZCMA.PRE.1
MDMKGSPSAGPDTIKAANRNMRQGCPAAAPLARDLRIAERRRKACLASRWKKVGEFTGNR